MTQPNILADRLILVIHGRTAHLYNLMICIHFPLSLISIKTGKLISNVTDDLPSQTCMGCSAHMATRWLHFELDMEGRNCVHVLNPPVSP